jgi:hypothetical protein
MAAPNRMPSLYFPITPYIGRDDECTVQMWRATVMPARSNFMLSEVAECETECSVASVPVLPAVPPRANVAVLPNAEHHPRRCPITLTTYTPERIYLYR